jgi:predicted nucleic acid-binding protein
LDRAAEPAVIVADTGAVVALLDTGDRHHAELRAIFTADPGAWLLPWAILPEVDYLVATELGDRAAQLWFDDLASGAFAIEWGTRADLSAAHRLASRHAALHFGLVDAVVMVIAERLRADIATVDLRDFGAVRLAHGPRLFPRDASPRGRRKRR